MTMNDELASKDSMIAFLERQNRVLRETLLDHFAMVAVASGRCPPAQAYNWAQEMMNAREACTALSKN